MSLADDLLNPIEGSNPSGADLRYEDVYAKIKEARREEAVPPAGMTESDRKIAENPLVIKLTSEALAKKTKDLWLAAWLSEALLKQNGFAGLKEGLALCHGFLEKFWDTLYPAIEDGDLELRAAPLEFLCTKLELPLRSVRLVQKEPFGFTDVQESRKLGYEADAKSDEAKQARAAAIEQGKVALEVLDKCFDATPKAFYAKTEKDLDACMEILGPLRESCDAKFGDVSPSWNALRSVIEEIRRVVHAFLQKKREKEPDPVEEGQTATAEADAGGGGASARMGAGPVAAGIVIPFADKEPEERRGAIAAVANAAAALRKLDPSSPAPYLMMRGLRWGELRAALSKPDLTLLEGPPTELRQHIKRLAIEGKWNDLLEAAENCLSLPCSRGWLDLHKFVLDACAGLGCQYSGIAIAIRSELKTLVRDLPQVLDVSLLDDSPAANRETRAWLQELVAEPSTPVGDATVTPDGAPAADGLPAADGAGTESLVMGDYSAPGWHRKFVDSHDLALEALKAGQAEKAIDTMMHEVARQLTGRGQFFRKLQLAEICLAAGKDEVAQPIIEDLAASIENNHLELWENPKTVAKALVVIIKNSRRVQGDDGERQRLFQKVVRLDPVQAVTFLGS